MDLAVEETSSPSSLPISNATVTRGLTHSLALSPAECHRSPSDFQGPVCYPRTGAPDEVVPDDWNAIPGARGCTPQACSFRDRLPELKSLGVARLFGLSTQSTEYQREVHDRLHLPYDLLSDEDLAFQRALNLPTFTWEGKTLVRRLSLAIEGAKIVKWWYPIFPPDSNVGHVITWLEQRKQEAQN